MVAVRPGVLEIGHRVDPDRVRNPPGRIGQLLDRAEGFGGKDGPIARLQDEEDVVVLGVNVLHFLEGPKLGIVLTKKVAIAVFESDEAGAAGHGQSDEKRDRKNRPAPADHPAGKRLGIELPK